MIGVGPSQQVIDEHLEQVERRTSGPSWDRGDLSLELLLGLRNRDVDKRLFELAGTRPDEGFGIGDSLLRKAAADPTIGRIELLLATRFSSLPLAWLAATAEEVISLTSSLLPRLRTPNIVEDLRHKAIFAALCEHAALSNATSALSELKGLVRGDWLRNFCIAKATGAALPAAKFFDSPVPAWARDFPEALTRDPLTGALSRAVLLTDPHRYRLDSPTWIRLVAHGVLYVDVDRMKNICDVYGLPAGDMVLVSLTEHLQGLFGDRVIRFGGEEFLVICDEQDLSRLAQEVVQSVAALDVPLPGSLDESVHFTVSVGVAHGAASMETIRAAEAAVQQAKASGRNRFVLGAE